MNKKRKRRLIAFVLAVDLIVVCLAVFGKVGLRNEAAGSGENENTNTASAQTSQNSDVKSMTFRGVGDNLMHDVLFVYPMQDTGTRDFTPMYANVKSLISDADFAYINLETICAGDDYGLSGYPNFNGPTEILDALADTGFDWFSTASNHTLDAGVDGLMAEMEYLDENLPQITYTGTAKSQEQKDTPTVVEINGIKVGLASFAYGLNGYTLPEGYEYAVNLFTTEDESGLNKEAIDEVIDKLQDVSDVQIVTMHWGQEYQYEPNDLQIETANYLNEKGVDVIIGAHPHVIQPVDIIESDAGKTLVYYSLGNFISGQDRNDTMIGGMADFTLTYNEKTKEVGFEDVTFRTLVTWQSVDLRTIYTVTAEDFTDELGASSNVYNVMGDDMSLEFVNSFTHEVLKDPDFLTIISAPAGWSADSQESETEDV